VADIGPPGLGYYTVHFACRLGPGAIIHATDVKREESTSYARGSSGSGSMAC